jgi:hypothetical protein
MVNNRKEKPNQHNGGVSGTNYQDAAIWMTLALILIFFSWNNVQII